MDDLIYRSAAINAIGERPLAWNEGEYELGLQNQWESDIDAIKNVPPAQPDNVNKEDDSISRRAAIEGICKEWCDENRIKRCKADPYRGEYDEDKFHCDGCDDVVVIKKIPSAQPAQQWTPCSERLPEIDELVLVTDDSGGVKTVDVDRCGQYECSEKRFWYYTQNAVAWIPLPEPYTERQEE